MYLLVMAGLPGTGKSTLARALAARLDAHVLDKDVVRTALFGPGRIDYSHDQDDVAVDATYAAAAYLRRVGDLPFAILDGRTYARRTACDALVHFTHAVGIPWCFVECTCAAQIALARIERDRDTHPAHNRSAELYRALAAEQDPIAGEHVVVDTGAGTTDEHVERCLAYFRKRGWAVP